MTIDGQLAAAGWLVQSREEMNRSAGLGIAVREFPTASGPVDYALFVGGTLCGVVEAKPGITGLWQVSGRSRTTFDEMVRLDLRYARSCSLLTDLRILLATPRAVVSGNGAC